MKIGVYICTCMCFHVCVCVRACVRVCVRVCELCHSLLSRVDMTKDCSIIFRSSCSSCTSTTTAPCQPQRTNTTTTCIRSVQSLTTYMKNFRRFMSPDKTFVSMKASCCGKADWSFDNTFHSNLLSLVSNSTFAVSRMVASKAVVATATASRSTLERKILSMKSSQSLRQWRQSPQPFCQWKHGVVPGCSLTEHGPQSVHWQLVQQFEAVPLSYWEGDLILWHSKGGQGNTSGVESCHSWLLVHPWLCARMVRLWPQSITAQKWSIFCPLHMAIVRGPFQTGDSMASPGAHMSASYNKNMGGVDKQDQLLHPYDCTMKPMMWMKKLFFHFMQVAACNAYILSKTGDNPGKSFLLFLESVICAWLFSDNMPVVEVGKTDDEVRLTATDFHSFFTNHHIFSYSPHWKYLHKGEYLFLYCLSPIHDLDMKNSRKSPASGGGSSKAKPVNQRKPWICLNCENAIEEDNDDVIECHKCKEWCHKPCTGLTGAQYNCLRHGGNFIQWFCVDCRENESEGKEPKSRLEAKMDSIRKVLTSLHDRLGRLEDTQKENLREVESKIAEVVERKVKDYMEENEEKEKRKLNTVICNLPKSPAESPEERKNDDQERVRDLMGKISDVQRNEVNNPVRLGKIQVGKNAEPRLLGMEDYIPPTVCKAQPQKICRVCTQKLKLCGITAHIAHPSLHFATHSALLTPQFWCGVMYILYKTFLFYVLHSTASC